MTISTLPSTNIGLGKKIIPKSKSITCAKCEPDSGADRLRICASCFESWPKGVTLEQYLNRPYKPKPVKCPDHLALTMRY